MKIYTRRGDAGQTDLFGGERVSKDALRVRAYGEVDELNAQLGVAVAAAAAMGDDAALASLAAEVQSALFDLGAYLATPDAARREKGGIAGLDDAAVERLESFIDRYSEGLPELKSFILPGGAPAAAAFHVARTVCRRAERAMVALHADDPVDGVALRYVNRLSDLFFVLARYENQRAGREDVAWRPREKR